MVAPVEYKLHCGTSNLASNWLSPDALPKGGDNMQALHALRDHMNRDAVRLS